MYLVQALIISVIVFHVIERNIGILCKFLPGKSKRIGLSKIRKDIVYVVPENRVQCHEAYLIRTQSFSFLVKEICDTLQKNRSLATSCNSVNYKNGHIGIADNGVLFLLNGCSYGLHFGRPGLGQ